MTIVLPRQKSHQQCQREDKQTDEQKPPPVKVGAVIEFH
jgi:hypothetical protein